MDEKDIRDANGEPTGASYQGRHFTESKRLEPVFTDDAATEQPAQDATAPAEEAGRTDASSLGDTDPALITVRHFETIDSSKGVQDARASEKPRKRHAEPVIALLCVLAIVAIGVGTCWAWMSSVNNMMSLDQGEREEIEDALVDPESNQNSDALYTLIIGSDSRNGEAARSDVIMLARVDASSGVVTFVSIPRDTMIYGESGGVEKINAAYNYGPASTVLVVSEFAGVPISHYVEVDFNGLKEVVDALGGVTVDIPEDITAGNGGMSFSAGEQRLNGEEALAYARERYNVSGGDFGRAQAQRQILEAIVREVLASGPLEIPGLVSELAKAVKTDLSLDKIVSYALELYGAENGLTVYSAAAPSYALNVDGISYVGTMYDEWQDMMRRMDAGLDPESTSSIPEEQANNEKLGAATNAASPRDYEDLLAQSPLTTDDVAH